MTTYTVRKQPAGYVIVRKCERIGQITTEAAIKFPYQTYFAHKVDADNVCLQLRKD